MNTPRPLLILQLRPEDIIANSEYACFLKYSDINETDTVRLRIEKNGIPDDLNIYDYAAIIVGGSPFDITTPVEEKSAIQNKIEGDFNTLLRQVVENDFPFLGACSGCGLLGNYLGTKITKKYGEPVSCATVELTETGKEDDLLQDFPDKIDVLLGHKEAVNHTPERASLLIQGTACPVQMFRIGQNVYATQFHPEADKEEFHKRIDTYRHHGYFAPAEADQLKLQVGERPTPYAQEILKRFVKKYYLQQDMGGV
jgi:GMP synthase (glutamine-hydrolysing)